MIVVHHFYQVGGGGDEAHHRTVCGGVSLCGAVQGAQDVARPQEGRRDLVRRQRRHEQNSLDDVICTVNMQDVLLRVRPNTVFGLLICLTICRLIGLIMLGNVGHC